MTGLCTLPEEEAAITVIDKIRDVMLFTVPVLRSAEVEALVEPDILMKDDDYERRFAKAYIHDEIPWMDLRHEVRDLMILAVPDIALFQDDLSFEDAEIPADGMEVCWAVANDLPVGLVKELVGSTVIELVAVIAEDSRVAAYSVSEMLVTPPSPKAMQTLYAPAATRMLPMPGPVVAIGAAAVEDVPAVEKLFDDPIFGIGIIEDVPVVSKALEEVVQIPLVDVSADYCAADEEIGFKIPYNIIVAGIVGELISSMLGQIPEAECAELKPITTIIEESSVKEIFEHISAEIVAEAI